MRRLHPRFSVSYLHFDNGHLLDGSDPYPFRKKRPSNAHRAFRGGCGVVWVPLLAEIVTSKGSLNVTGRLKLISES